MVVLGFLTDFVHGGLQYVSTLPNFPEIYVLPGSFGVSALRYWSEEKHNLIVSVVAGHCIGGNHEGNSAHKRTPV